LLTPSGPISGRFDWKRFPWLDQYFAFPRSPST
jgi:hypothetical protein